MKKTLLIYPSVVCYGSGIVRPNLPIGLMYLSAYLKKNNVEVGLLDALAEGGDRQIRKKVGVKYGLSDGEIKKRIVSFKPSVVGISTMFTAYYDDSIKLAKLIKKIDKKILVVMGGSHVSVDPETVAKNKYVDIVVYGEGEKTLLEIVKGKNISEIDGIVYKKGKKIIKNKPRELIRNLDELPFPAWEMVDLSKYDLGGVFNMKKPVFPIVSSRGCPGHCLYCSVNSVWRHCWRGRSAKNVVDEIELLNKKYLVKEIAFQDDSLSVDKERLKMICLELIKRKLKIKWTTPNGIAHWTLDKDTLDLMKNSGCYRITFGIESGNPELRRWVGKPYSLEQAKELTKYANKIGLWTLATNIIGFPYETKKEMDDTFEYSLKSDVDLAFFFRLGPRPGTPIYEIFKKEGWLMKDRKILFSEDVACRTKYFTGKEIIDFQKHYYKKFLINRLFRFYRIFGKIKSWDDFKYIVSIIGHGVRLVKNIGFANKQVTSKSLKV
ncbi:MAG TPA: radical SAM protein [Candidatus Woesebacteria bacterium]|nr:radical SAM protein [Candidatus Woesebacteria bacterium]